MKTRATGRTRRWDQLFALIRRPRLEVFCHLPSQFGEYCATLT